MFRVLVRRRVAGLNLPSVRLAPFSSSSSKSDGLNLDDPDCNIPANIASRIGTDLHCRKNHPLHTIKTIIQEYWRNQDPSDGGGAFLHVDNISPFVSTCENFDSLLIPPDHVSRSKGDTYYVNQHTVLRTHTSAHQSQLLKEGHNKFLVTGEVYRRDEIDSSHYPIFHQMEGVKLFSEDMLDGATSETDQQHAIQSDLQKQLEGMTRALFGDVEMRWIDAYFPFTEPSLELEIYFQDEWLEVLGCGVIQPKILAAANRSEPGWAFGLGLERLAMVLFQIPDIRLFWTQDPRFHDQFASGEIVTFQPYSRYPPCFKDISFWLPEDGRFHENDLNEVVRSVAGDVVEKVELIDDFVHPRTSQHSKCFRIAYRSMDRSLTNSEVDKMQSQVRDLAVDQLGVTLR